MVLTMYAPAHGLTLKKCRKQRLWTDRDRRKFCFGMVMCDVFKPMRTWKTKIERFESGTFEECEEMCTFPTSERVFRYEAAMAAEVF